MAERSVSFDVSTPHPGLRGHHQRHRGPSSTRTAGGTAQGRPWRSRHAAIAGRTWPLVGPAGIATAAPSPSLPRSAPASAATTSVVAVGPRPEWPAATRHAAGGAKGKTPCDQHCAQLGRDPCRAAGKGPMLRATQPGHDVHAPRLLPQAAPSAALLNQGDKNRPARRRSEGEGVRPFGLAQLGRDPRRATNSNKLC